MDILIIDNDREFRERIQGDFVSAGFHCQAASRGGKGLQLVKEMNPRVVFCEMNLPDMDGIDFLEQLNQQKINTKTFIVGGRNSVRSAVLSFRRGAIDFIMKPVTSAFLITKLNRLKEEIRIRNEVKSLREEISSPYLSNDIISQSDEMKKLFSEIKKVAPTKSNVIIEGESGTGKELIARTIHNECYPAGHPFVPVNCAALTESLMESELFGHREGAFTGAVEDKKGLLEAANDGTLFLDEISSMPKSLQTKLLRAIETKQITPLGTTEPTQVNPRFVAASNQSCKELVKNNQLRKDLYYRLNVITIEIPPLRERREDIPLLIEHFIKKFNDELKSNVSGIDAEAMQILKNHSWPGNVRELKNIVEQAVIFQKKGLITIENLPDNILGDSSASNNNQDLRNATNRFQKEHITTVLAQADGDKEKAANLLGIDRSTLYRKLSETETVTI